MEVPAGHLSRPSAFDLSKNILKIGPFIPVPPVRPPASRNLHIIIVRRLSEPARTSRFRNVLIVRLSVHLSHSAGIFSDVWHSLTPLEWVVFFCLSRRTQPVYWYELGERRGDPSYVSILGGKGGGEMQQDINPSFFPW